MSRETHLRLAKVVTDGAGTDERRTGPLRTLGAVARRALADEIEAKLRAILDETASDLIVGGWQEYRAVRQAIDASAKRPGADQIVPLATHTISATRDHDLDVEIDGLHVMTLSVEVEVRARVCDATTVIRDGRIRSVRSGEANVEGTVTVAGVRVARRALVFPLAAELVTSAGTSNSSIPSR